MAIIYDKRQKIFHLQGNHISYVMQVVHGGYLTHRYWGKRIGSYHDSNKLLYLDRAFSPNPDPKDRTFSLDTIPREYPTYGTGDYREPAMELKFADGSEVSDFQYNSYEIMQGKPVLEGLPATYTENDDEAETLKIVLKDSAAGVTLILFYTLFRDFDAVARSAMLLNCGKQNIRIERIFSASVDFRSDDFDLLTLSGAHANERNMIRRRIVPGTQMVDSCRGASSHQQNPFCALMDRNADEGSGEVFAFHLVYSGNFSARVQVDQFGCTRVGIGINPFDFEWLLTPGEHFQTPESILVYSDCGLEKISHTYHRLYQTRLCRGKFRDKLRPILINNWEATYFQFNESKIKRLAQEANSLGIELFVLDDGWFGHRDNDNSSLGDWIPDQRKLPEGLAKLAEYVNGLGMQFGLWFEPEMISVDSCLYRTHPDWCLHVKNRPRVEGRGQLVLDLSRDDVCQYIVDSISKILASANISYVKWDMNRHMTDIGSALLPPERQRETAHRYILGLYYVLEQITSRFPDVLFESCSGGGGRFDPGMLYYMPQIWTSDNTDAVSRIKIQYGTSIAYPVSTIGSHVSAVPNEQLGRVTPINTRGYVAMSGNLGYELDLTKLSVSEKKEIKKQVEVYKKIRPIVQFGTLYRLLNPFYGNEAAWCFVSSNVDQAAFFYFNILSQPAVRQRVIRLRGLDAKTKYEIIDEDGGVAGVFFGDELVNVGITMPIFFGDFRACLFLIRKV